METLAIGIRNAGTPAHSFLNSFLDLDHLSASVDKWEGDGLDLGLSGVGTSYGSLCEDCVCLI